MREYPPAEHQIKRLTKSQLFYHNASGERQFIGSLIKNLSRDGIVRSRGVEHHPRELRHLVFTDGMDPGDEISRLRKSKRIKHQRGERCGNPASVSGACDGLKCTPGDVVAAALVAEKMPPAAGLRFMPRGVYPVHDGSGASDNDDARQLFRTADECNLRVVRENAVPGNPISSQIRPMTFLSAEDETPASPKQHAHDSNAAFASAINRETTSERTCFVCSSPTA